MVAQSGRDMRWSRDGTPIVGARSDSLTVTSEPIDQTDKDDGGWRTLLPDVGVRSVSGTVACVMKDDTFAAISVGTASALLEECDLAVDGIYTLTGDFFLSNIEVTGEQEGVVEFTAELQGSGTFVISSAPYITASSAITGTAEVGETLTFSAGTWTGDATISFVRPWQRSLDGITWTNVGSTGGTYVLQLADLGHLIRKLETATNGVGEASAPSNTLGPVAA